MLETWVVSRDGIYRGQQAGVIIRRTQDLQLELSKVEEKAAWRHKKAHAGALGKGFCLVSSDSYLHLHCVELHRELEMTLRWPSCPKSWKSSYPVQQRRLWAQTPGGIGKRSRGREVE